MKCPECGSQMYALMVGFSDGSRPCVKDRKYCEECDRVYKISFEIE